MPFRQSRYDSYLKEREKNFDLDFGVRAKLPEYNALLDTNMRNYFENRDLQNHLLKTGQIDKIGRVIDLDKMKSKLHIIEKEFLRAEKIERDKQRDEEEVRRQIRTKRLHQFELNRNLARIHRSKTDTFIQNEIMSATKEAKGLSNAITNRTRRKLKNM